MSFQRYPDLVAQRPKQKFFTVYLASIIMMMLFVQVGFPDIAPDTLSSRVTWSLMVGIFPGWILGYIVHKIFHVSNIRIKKYLPWLR